MESKLPTTVRGWALCATAGVWGAFAAVYLVPFSIAFLTELGAFDKPSARFQTFIGFFASLGGLTWFPWVAGGLLGLVTGFAVGLWFDLWSRRAMWKAGASGADGQTGSFPERSELLPSRNSGPDIYAMPVGSDLRSYLLGKISDAKIRVKIQNVGNAPARILQFYCSITIDNRIATISHSQHACDVKEYAVEPGGASEVTVDVQSSLQPTPGMVENFNRNFLLIYFRTFVRYADNGGNEFNSAATWRLFPEGSPDELKRVDFEGDCHS